MAKTVAENLRELAENLKAATRVLAERIPRLPLTSTEEGEEVQTLPDPMLRAEKIIAQTTQELQKVAAIPLLETIEPEKSDRKELNAAAKALADALQAIKKVLEENKKPSQATKRLSQQIEKVEEQIKLLQAAPKQGAYEKNPPDLMKQDAVQKIKLEGRDLAEAKARFGITKLKGTDFGRAKAKIKKIKYEEELGRAKLPTKPKLPQKQADELKDMLDRADKLLNYAKFSEDIRSRLFILEENIRKRMQEFEQYAAREAIEKLDKLLLQVQQFNSRRYADYLAAFSEAPTIIDIPVGKNQDATALMKKEIAKRLSDSKPAVHASLSSDTAGTGDVFIGQARIHIAATKTMDGKDDHFGWGEQFSPGKNTSTMLKVPKSVDHATLLKKAADKFGKGIETIPFADLLERMRVKGELLTEETLKQSLKEVGLTNKWYAKPASTVAETLMKDLKAEVKAHREDLLPGIMRQVESYVAKNGTDKPIYLTAAADKEYAKMYFFYCIKRGYNIINATPFRFDPVKFDKEYKAFTKTMDDKSLKTAYKETAEKMDEAAKVAKKSKDLLTPGKPQALDKKQGLVVEEEPSPKPHK